jgi:hypothetical protein
LRICGSARDAWLIYDPDDVTGGRLGGGRGRGGGGAPGRGVVGNTEILRACVTVWGDPWYKFSNVLYIVTLHSENSRVLTFENLCQGV